MAEPSEFGVMGHYSLSWLVIPGNNCDIQIRRHQGCEARIYQIVTPFIDVKFSKLALSAKCTIHDVCAGVYSFQSVCQLFSSKTINFSILDIPAILFQNPSISQSTI